MKRSLLLLVVVFSAACGAASLAPSRPLSITSIYQDLNSGLDSSTRRVIREAGELQTLWPEVVKYYGTKPPIPLVDFSQEIVVVAAAGTKSTGGYSITIESAIETSGTLTIHIASGSPGRCGVTLALTRPIHIVRIPKQAASVVFVELAFIPEGCQ
jgi:hypothetical protein